MRRRVGSRVLSRLAHRARRAGQLLTIDAARWASLGLRIVDDVEMAALHLQYMDEAGPTDVLSFRPAVAGPELGPGGARLGLGDLVLDWDAVTRQARGWTARAQLDEATVLLVHGLAHLLGHDHRDRHEGRRMARTEASVLRRLGVVDQVRPYAPRLVRARPNPDQARARR